MEKEEIKNDYKLERWITLILALMFLIPFLAYGQEPEVVTLNDVHFGSLLLKTNQQGLFIPAPTLSTNVQMRVNGMILRARVVQEFRNPAETCVEAIYVFPLPENAAVDRMFMTIGNRRIEGQIKEREEARRTYERAKSEGRKASLLEQQRPNIFTVSVASLLPDEKAEIEIEYQQIVDYRDGSFSLRFPMVVAPRYFPSGQRSAAGEPSPLVERPGDEVIPNTYSPSPPAAGHRPFNPVQLQVELNSGVALRSIESPFHPIRTVPLAHGRYEVTLAAGDVPANRDFELVWQPEMGAEPAATVFTETVNGQSYALVMLVPPAQHAASVRLPRETIYIIDSSGSMSGESMDQAKEALILGLLSLNSSDTFNVIDFDSDADPLFDAPRPADVATLAEALEFVKGLEADEGTEMLGALTLALETPAAPDGRVRQVIFITDGQVGNEDQLFTYISSNLGARRLFPVAIGSAPNSHFMRRAAQVGRGTFTYIGDVATVKTKMNELFRKLDSPVLTDVSIKFDAPVSEVWPQRVPDLYVGEPLLLTVKLPAVTGAVALSGRTTAGEVSAAGADLSTWSSSVVLSAGGAEAGIGKLWARRKIEALDDSVSAGADAQQVRQAIIQTALEHHLVSQHTSLVAVDVTPTGIDASRCESQLVPLNLPKGWRQPQIPGSLPTTATPATLLILLGLSLLAAGAALVRLS